MRAAPDLGIRMMYFCVIQGYDKAYKDRKSLKAKCDKAAALLAENGFVVRKAAADTDKPDMRGPATEGGSTELTESRRRAQWPWVR